MIWDFSGRTVVVASVGPTDSHLGRVSAEQFLAAGATVLALDQDDAVLAALRGAAGEAADRLVTVNVDVASLDALTGAVADLGARFDAVDVVVTAHSQLDLIRIDGSSAAVWERSVQFNLLGPAYTAMAFLPLLRGSSAGSIIHIGSIDGSLGNPQVPAYSVSKGGIVPMTHVMAEEFGREGIRVNSVARGMTIGRGDAVPPMFGPLIAQTPLGRPAFPDEVVAAVLFLASDQASYINGIVLPVDGGRTGITQGSRPPLG